MLYFITGNQFKFKEVKHFFPEIEQLAIDLPEIQEVDAKKIIQTKLQEALKHHSGPFMIEDTSLYLSCLNGLPGPLGKWFEKVLGDQKLVDICEKLGDTKARCTTIIGYAKNAEHIIFFEGTIEGNLVQPKGDRSFGFNAIFQPKGMNKTFGEMSIEEKNKISMRGLALHKLREYLESSK